MNRREALQAGLGVITACGLQGEVKALNVSDPQAMVLMFPQKLTQSQRKSIAEEWRRAFAGSAMGSLPVVLLDGGADIKVIDRKEA